MKHQSTQLIKNREGKLESDNTPPQMKDPQKKELTTIHSAKEFISAEKLRAKHNIPDDDIEIKFNFATLGDSSPKDREESSKISRDISKNSSGKVMQKIHKEPVHMQPVPSKHGQATMKQLSRQGSLKG